MRGSETIFAKQNADELWLESCGILEISAASEAPGHNRDTPCTSPGFDIRASCLRGSGIDAVRPPLALYCLSDKDLRQRESFLFWPKPPSVHNGVHKSGLAHRSNSKQEPHMASPIRRPSGIYYIQFCVSGKARRVSICTESLQVAREKLRQLESVGCKPIERVRCAAGATPPDSVSRA